MARTSPRGKTAMSDRVQPLHWAHVVLSPGAEELVVQIWQRAVDRGGAFDADYAVFQRHRRDGDLALFFSPSALELARIFGARRGTKPARRGLQLLVGSEAAFDIHFQQPVLETPGHCPRRCGSAGCVATAPEVRAMCLQASVMLWRRDYRRLQLAENRLRRAAPEHSSRQALERQVAHLAGRCNADLARISAAAQPAELTVD